MNMKLSHSGRYLMYGETLHDLYLNEFHKIDELSFEFFIKFLKESTIGTYKNGVKDISDLNNFLRETIYNISNVFDGKTKDSFIMEYELKYSNELLKEGIEDYTQHIEKTWSFVDSKLNQKGLYEQGLLDKAKSAVTGAFDYIKQKGIPWVMENLREALFSWGGAAVQTLLGTIGAPFGGNIVLWVVWGAMLAYDIYEAIQGRPNYANILIDIISIATFGVGGKIAVQLFRQLGIMSGAITRNLGQMLSKISKSSNGSWFAKTVKTVGSSLGSILSYLGKGIAYAGDKLGIQTIKKSGSSIVSWTKNFISQLVNNPTVKRVTSSKLAPAAATGALVAGINQYTGRDNRVFAGSFGERGDEILATSQGIPTEKELRDMMTSLSKIEPDYEGLLP
jgi:hypothetical protein